jgi:hypothetical protein
MHTRVNTNRSIGFRIVEKIFIYIYYVNEIISFFFFSVALLLSIVLPSTKLIHERAAQIQDT